MTTQLPNRSAPPAGWYHDPGGMQVLRWWDGTQWGPHTQPLPAQAPSFPQNTQATAPGPAPILAGQPSQAVAVKPVRKRRKVLKVILGGIAAGVIAVVVASVLSHMSESVPSSSPCTSNSCIVQEAKQALVGSVAKDESVITNLSCTPSSVQNPDLNVYTASCIATYSDGVRTNGIASVLLSQNKVTWEPTGA
jgi:Protein of unknown function (DUF2510)